jgi:anti-sigma regulatory factor (Ser/Thr protein kinase)
MTVRAEDIHMDKVVARSGHYLERMGLFKMLGLKSPFYIEEHEQAGRFIPLTVIKSPEDQTRFITDMIPLLHLAPAQADAIKYTIGELVRNVIEHSETRYGAVVAAQYYSKSSTIRLGICDTGVGIRRTITQSWPARNDLEAIKLALVPGVSGTTRREGGTDVNAGAGLFFIKSMAMVGRDYFMVYSGSGLYKLLKRRQTKGLPRLNADPDRDKHSETNVAPCFPGTLVAIDISLSTTDEFTSLLGIIRRTYTQAVRERRKARYKRPQFI